MYEDVIRTLGTVFDNRKLYGPTHNVTVRSLEQAYDLLNSTLGTEESLVFAVTPDEFNINNSVVETKNNLIQHFVDLLRAHEVSTLTLTGGLTPDEFLQFIDLVAADPGDGQSALENRLNSADFPHISSRKVQFVEITDDEIVVNRDELNAEQRQQQASDNVMQFLQMDEQQASAATGEELGRDMQELLTSAVGLGEVIVKSAGLSLDLALPVEQTLDESVLHELIQRVVEALERAFSVLKNDPSAKSQTGKKRLKKALAGLKDELETVIKSAVEDINDEDMSPVYSALDAMTDELEIDALAAEYLRKRRLIESSEKRLLKYLERQSDNVDQCDLKERLLEGGLSEFGWNMLVAASGLEKPKSPGERLSLESPEFRQLQEKLVKLTKIFNNIERDSSASPEQLEQVISQVESQLEKLIKQTEKRIKHIMESIIADEVDADSRETESSRKLTRRQLLELIAEIVQELYQPLAVVQCVLQSLLARRINPERVKEQEELLELAERSARRMNLLIGELYTVVGNPTSLTPMPPSTSI